MAKIASPSSTMAASCKWARRRHLRSPGFPVVADFVGSSNVACRRIVKRDRQRDGWGSRGRGDPREHRDRARHPGARVSVSFIGAATRLGSDAEGSRLHATVPVGVTVPEQERTLSFPLARARCM